MPAMREDNRMILYYRDNGPSVTEWYFDAFGNRVNIGTLAKGPNWARWLRGDVPLAITLCNGKQLVVERMIEG